MNEENVKIAIDVLYVMIALYVVSVYATGIFVNIVKKKIQIVMNA